MPAFLPFAIAGASTLANAIRGGIQAGQARKLEQKFESLDKALQPVSPEQYAYLNRVRQMQRSMAMGTDPTSAMARRGLAQGLAQTQGNIARVGGGPSTVSGLLRAQQGYGQGMSQIAGNAFQASQGLMQQEQGLIGDIQNAVYGLQMKRRNLAQLEAVQKRQASTDSMMAAVAGLGQMATMFPKKVAGDFDLAKLNPYKYSADANTGSLLPGGSDYRFGDMNKSSAPANYGVRFDPANNFAMTERPYQNFRLSPQQIDFQAPSRFAGF